MNNLKLKEQSSMMLKQLRKVTQIVGNRMSGMIMPVIGVIMAWGLITAFFIPTGWTPVKSIEQFIVGPVILYLIPTLIGFMGGYQKYGVRGGAMGAFGAFCIIAGTMAYRDKLIWANVNILSKRDLGPQFLGAMIAGPLSSYVLTTSESLWEGRIKPGFEMLVNNLFFALSAFAMGLGIFFLLPFPVIGINYLFGQIIDALTGWKAMPVTSLLVEPAKPLFLNNAINHGVFTPLGIQQVTESGKSLLFYIESNPGPGMGMLMAIFLFDKNMKNKASASSASIIHFFGGIHEVYFPFILARPLLVIATMAGGVVGVAMFQIFDAGAVAAASPGSVVALYSMSYGGGMAYAGLTLGIFGSLITSFIVSAIILKFVYKGQSVQALDRAMQRLQALKGQGRTVAPLIKNPQIVNKNNIAKVVRNLKKIVFACDAGMGSSAMGAGLLRNIIHKVDKNIIITHASLSTIPQDSDLIITQDALIDRAIKQAANKPIYVIREFLNKAEYKLLVDTIKKGIK